jgi:hypothetical protein
MEGDHIQSEDEVVLFIEWSNHPAIVQAGLGEDLDRVKKEAQKALEITTSVIRSMAYRMAKTIDEIKEQARPDDVEVEFSVKLDLEGGVIVPMVAKTTTGGQFNIKFRWMLEKPIRATVLVSETK